MQITIHGQILIVKILSGSSMNLVIFRKKFMSFLLVNGIILPTDKSRLVKMM